MLHRQLFSFLTALIVATVGVTALPTEAHATAKKKATVKKKAVRQKSASTAAAAATMALPAALPTADAAQMTAASRVLYGNYHCDAGRSLLVEAAQNNVGYVNVFYGSRSWTMKPVVGVTGAIRLEDIKKVALFVQVANKSMMLDQIKGERIVDGCIHPKQR